MKYQPNDGKMYIPIIGLILLRSPHLSAISFRSRKKTYTLHMYVYTHDTHLLLIKEKPVPISQSHHNLLPIEAANLHADTGLGESQGESLSGVPWRQPQLLCEAEDGSIAQLNSDR